MALGVPPNFLIGVARIAWPGLTDVGWACVPVPPWLRHCLQAPLTDENNFSRRFGPDFVLMISSLLIPSRTVAELFTFRNRPDVLSFAVWPLGVSKTSTYPMWVFYEYSMTLSIQLRAFQRKIDFNGGKVGENNSSHSPNLEVFCRRSSYLFSC